MKRATKFSIVGALAVVGLLVWAHHVHHHGLSEEAASAVLFAFFLPFVVAAAR